MLSKVRKGLIMVLNRFTPGSNKVNSIELLKVRVAGGIFCNVIIHANLPI